MTCLLIEWDVAKDVDMALLELEMADNQYQNAKSTTYALIKRRARRQIIVIHQCDSLNLKTFKIVIILSKKHLIEKSSI